MTVRLQRVFLRTPPKNNKKSLLNLNGWRGIVEVVVDIHKNGRDGMMPEILTRSMKNVKFITLQDSKKQKVVLCSR